MSTNLSIILLGCPHFTEELEENYSKIFHAKSLKDLVRLLIDREVDLVLISAKFSDYTKLNKIYNQYKVPFVSPKSSPEKLSFLKYDSKLSLTENLKAQQGIIFSHRVERKNQSLLYIMKNLSGYTEQVIHATKDLYITETRNYFKKNFNVKNCHWIEVKNLSSKLPPILKLKQELEAQKVDQSSLLADIDSCTSEVVHNDKYQIWKDSTGHYMVFMWIPDREDKMQCIVLNQLKLHKRFEMEEFLDRLMPFLLRRWDLTQVVAEAQSQIYIDSLTDLYNQKFLVEVVDKKIEEYRRYKTPFSVLFIDVDHFKRVNDSLGHLVGSNILTQLGDVLKEQIRNSDYAFRYGGDEFIILLSHTEGVDAELVAERVRNTVEKFEFNVNEIVVNITVSIGLAFYPKHAQSAEEIVRIADEAMYYGKHKSRNIVYKAS